MAGTWTRWRLIAVGSLGIVLSLATVSLNVAASMPSAGRHPWGTRIAFVRLTPQNGQPRIYTISPHGHSPPATLPLAVSAAVSPAWSPNGARLAIIGGQSIVGTGNVTINDSLYVSAANGMHLHRLATGRGHVRGLAWAPDSTRIVLVHASPTGSDSSLWTIGVDSHTMRRVTSGHIDLEPSWSPDGRVIAFVRIDPKTYRSGIWLVRPDGSGLRRILQGWANITEPVWSPSGSSLLVEDGKAIYRVSPDGHRRRTLVRLTTDSKGAREDPQPAWSPDGTSIVFCQLQPGRLGVSDLWEVGMNAKGLHRLTNASGLDTSPTWGP